MRLSPRKYAEALINAVEEQPKMLPDIARRFVELLRRRRRSRMLPGVLTALETVWNERRGLRPVRVTTARPMTVEKLQEIFGSDTPIAATVDDRLIAGAVVERGDERYDASLATKLKRLKYELARKDS